MSASKNQNGSLLFFDSLVSYGPMHEGETLNACNTPSFLYCCIPGCTGAAGDSAGVEGNEC